MDRKPGIIWIEKHKRLDDLPFNLRLGNVMVEVGNFSITIRRGQGQTKAEWAQRSCAKGGACASYEARKKCLIGPARVDGGEYYGENNGFQQRPLLH